MLREPLSWSSIRVPESERGEQMKVSEHIKVHWSSVKREAEKLKRTKCDVWWDPEIRAAERNERMGTLNWSTATEIVYERVTFFILISPSALSFASHYFSLPFFPYFSLTLSHVSLSVRIMTRMLRRVTQPELLIRACSLSLTDKDNRVIKKSIIKRSRTTNHSDKDRRFSVSMRTSLLASNRAAAPIKAFDHKSQLCCHRDDTSVLEEFLWFSCLFLFDILFYFLFFCWFSVLPVLVSFVLSCFGEMLC